MTDYINSRNFPRKLVPKSKTALDVSGIAQPVFLGTPKVPVDKDLARQIDLERLAGDVLKGQDAVSPPPLTEPSYLTCSCVVGVCEFLGEGSYGIGEQSARVIAEECRGYPQNIFFRYSNTRNVFSAKDAANLFGIPYGTNLDISVQETFSESELELLRSSWKSDFLDLFAREVAESAGPILDRIHAEIATYCRVPDFNRVTHRMLIKDPEAAQILVI